jgi:hypothetical protein
MDHDLFTFLDLDLDLDILLVTIVNFSEWRFLPLADDFLRLSLPLAGLSVFLNLS